MSEMPGRAESGRRSPARRAALVAACLAVLSVAFALGLLDVRRRWVGSDFTVYVVGGRAFFDGRNPYEVTSPGGWHYVYPPLFGMLVSPLHVLSHPAQVSIWFVVSGVLGGLCFLECRRLAKLVASSGASAAGPQKVPHWLVHTTTLSVLWPVCDTLQRGQVGLLIAYLLLLGFRVALESPRGVGKILGGIVMALPITFKLTPVLPVAFIVLVWLIADHLGGGGPTRGRRGLAVGSGVIIGLTVFVLVIPGAMIGWDTNVAYLRAWAMRMKESARAGTEGGDMHVPRNQSLSNAVELFNRWAPPAWSSGASRARDPLYPNLLSEPRVPRPLADFIVWSFRLVSVGLLVWAGWRLVSRDGPSAELAAFGLACVLTLVISPISRGHHYVIALPAILFVPWWLWREGAGAAARRLSMVPLVLLWIHYAAIDTDLIYRPAGSYLAWTIGLLGVGITLWFVAACTLILRSRPRRAMTFCGGGAASCGM